MKMEKMPSRERRMHLDTMTVTLGNAYIHKTWFNTYANAHRVNPFPNDKI